MCGICGIWYFNDARHVTASYLRTMSASLEHRGPDQAGEYVEQAFGCAVRRLCIVDTPGSGQPLANEDGRLRLICNGEIYNYRDLRRQLTPRHRFSTDGDSEPILHLYEEYGRQCVDHLRGMFAFALWDSAEQRLLLAVDRFGKKPLYYALDRYRVVFASELKALLTDPNLPRELDDAALDEYLACGYIGSPRSMFRSIRKLPPGHTLLIERDGTARLIEYWHPAFAMSEQQERRSFANAAVELRGLLEEAVYLRLDADQPIGAFLSGGVDSSAVVALASRLSRHRLQTFSVGFEEASYDESAYAQAVADHCGTEHQRIIVTAHDALYALPHVVRQFDEPFADSSMIPTYLLSRAARQHVKAVLSGDGGDEVFGGYFQHLYGYRQQFVQSMIPSPFRRSAAWAARFVPACLKFKPYLATAALPAAHWVEPTTFFSPQQRHALYAGNRPVVGTHESLRTDIFRHNAAFDGLSQLQLYDLIRYLPGDILVKVDRAAMLAALEVRSPLLDHTLFAFMARTPPHYRVGLRAGKRLLKAAVAPLLPPEVLHREKQGFSIPQAEWVGTALLPLAREILSEPSPLFEREQVRRLFTEHEDGCADHKDRLWALLVFELWSREVLAA